MDLTFSSLLLEIIKLCWSFEFCDLQQSNAFTYVWIHFTKLVQLQLTSTYINSYVCLVNVIFKPVTSNPVFSTSEWLSKNCGGAGLSCPGRQPWDSFFLLVATFRSLRQIMPPSIHPQEEPICTILGRHY